MGKCAEIVNHNQYDIDHNSIKLIWKTLFQIQYINLDSYPVITNKNHKDVQFILFL